MDLIATCPNCDAKYRIDVQQALIRGLKRVRCKGCRRVFSLDEALAQEDLEMEGLEQDQDITIFDEGPSFGSTASDADIPRLDLDRTDVEIVPDEPPSGVVTAGTSILLEVMRGRNRGLNVRLSRERTTIGRFGTDIYLTDAKISRCHAAVLLTDGRLRVKDLNSTNGTYVNGRRVDERPLGDGDSIAVGDTLLRVHFETFS